MLKSWTATRGRSVRQIPIEAGNFNYMQLIWAKKCIGSQRQKAGGIAQCGKLVQSAETDNLDPKLAGYP